MPNDNRMPMPMEQASYETSGPAPTSGKQDEIAIAESVLPEGARVERETARSEMGVGGGKADKWRGGGDYYYEVTPQGIKVTGGDKAKTLTGGKSTVLRWSDTNPKTMQMIQAILASRTDKDSELGSTYKPKPEIREADVQTWSSPVDADEVAERMAEGYGVSRTDESPDPAYAGSMDEDRPPTYADKRMNAVYSAQEEGRKLDMSPRRALEAAMASDPKLAAMMADILASRTDKDSAEPTRDVKDGFKEMFGPSLSEQMRSAAETYDDRRTQAVYSALNKHGYSERD